MLIQVIRSDNHCDYIRDSMLDSLIEANDIVKFKRGTEWVTIGTIPTRKCKQETTFKDKDRRAVDDSTFTREYRKAYSSSLEPF
jgi:hypothetical protein